VVNYACAWSPDQINPLPNSCALGLGAADVTKNHPKCSGENRLNLPAKPLKCWNVLRYLRNFG
jgi:hypothetical protein